MLVQVRGLDGFRLQVEEVAPRVGLYAQREVRVRVDVPEGPAEERGVLVRRAEGGVAGALDIGEGRGQGGGYLAVETGVRTGI